MLNTRLSLNLLLSCSDKTEKAAGEEGLFKEKELELLAKKVAEVEKWRGERLKEQELLPLSEMPKLTVAMINMKVGGRRMSFFG